MPHIIAGGKLSAAAPLLGALAAALNALEAAGHPVTLAHGAVITGAGYVLPPCEPGRPWEARARLPGPVTAPPGDDDN
jgi:hypothetical protein